MKLFAFDVEANDLFDNTFFMVAYATSTGEMGYFKCPISGYPSEFVIHNVIPHIAHYEDNTVDERDMCIEFCKVWENFNSNGYKMISHCSFPVDTGFMHKCLQYWEGNKYAISPYPLLDAASILLAQKKDPYTVNCASHDPIEECKALLAAI